MFQCVLSIKLRHGLLAHAKVLSTATGGFCTQISSAERGKFMSTLISLMPLATGRMIGMRSKAQPVRREIESAISHGNEVVVDFNGVEATQSFVDELIGVLIFNRGPSVLQSLAFKHCSGNVKAIIQFVAADRSDQFVKRQRAASAAPRARDFSRSGFTSLHA